MGSSGSSESTPVPSGDVCISYCYQSNAFYTYGTTETASLYTNPQNAKYYGNGPYSCTTNNCNSGNKACTNINPGTPAAIGLGVGLGIGAPLIFVG